MSSIEELYIWVIKQLSPSYIIFRFIVWGAALFFFYKTLENLKLNISYALFFFISIYLIWFSYARASLSMALMFYGLSVIHSQDRHKFSKKLLGWGMILISFYFHKSSIFGIAVIVLSEFLLSIKIKRTWVVVIACLSFPILLHYLSVFMNNQLLQIEMQEENVLNDYMISGSQYLYTEYRSIGMGTLLQALFERLPYYMIAIACCRVVFRRIPIDKQILPFIWCFIFLILAATLFLFNHDLNTSVLYGRFMRYLQIPACIVLTYLYSNKIFINYIRFTYKLAIAGVFYTLLYVLYNCIVVS